jgi:hypothetical protein
LVILEDGVVIFFHIIRVQTAELFKVKVKAKVLPTTDCEGPEGE